MFYNKFVLLIIILFILIILNYYMYKNYTYESFVDNNEAIINDIYLDETNNPDETNSPDETNIPLNDRKQLLNSLEENINNNKISIDLLACSNSGSLILLLSNNDNLMYISKNNGKNWLYKKLPKFIEYSKIYLIELNINNYLIVLFGKHSGIYISTSMGDIWKLISFNKGNDLCYSEKLNYIYIATNSGILFNNNELNVTRNECDNECLTNYDMYEGDFKFNFINRDEIITKNITNIQCVPDGDIIVYSIDNTNLYSIKHENNIRWDKMSGLTWKNIGYTKPENYKEIVNNKLSELLKNKNIISIDEKNMVDLNDNDVVIKSFIKVDNYYYVPININLISEIKNVNSIIILEDQLFGNNGNVIVGDDMGLHLYTYQKNEEDKLIHKKNLSLINISESVCKFDSKCSIKINKLIRYKMATKYSFMLLINNDLLLCNDISKTEKFLPIKKLSKKYIKDFVINKNGTKAILLEDNGNIIVNNDLQNYFNDKSDFESITFNFKNSF